MVRRAFLFLFLMFSFRLLAINQTEVAVGGDFAVQPNFLQISDNPFFFDFVDTHKVLFYKQQLFKDVYGSRVDLKDINYNYNLMNAFGIGVKYKLFYKMFFFQIGFRYYYAIPYKASYIINTKPGSDPGKRDPYEDYWRNYDAIMENDVDFAKGLIPTGGKDVKYEMTVRAKEMEVPVLFGFALFDNKYVIIYSGLGPTLFYGYFVREISNTIEDGPNSVTDIDRIYSTAVGFQFIIGAEIKLFDKLGVTLELLTNIGGIVPLADDYHTDRRTTDSLFFKNDKTDLGGPEERGVVTRPGMPKESGILFNNPVVTLGALYYITSGEFKYRRYEAREKKLGFIGRKIGPLFKMTGIYLAGGFSPVKENENSINAISFTFGIFQDFPVGEKNAVNISLMYWYATKEYLKNMIGLEVSIKRKFKRIRKRKWHLYAGIGLTEYVYITEKINEVNGVVVNKVPARWNFWGIVISLGTVIPVDVQQKYRVYVVPEFRYRIFVPIYDKVDGFSFFVNNFSLGVNVGYKLW